MCHSIVHRSTAAKCLMPYPSSVPGKAMLWLRRRARMLHGCFKASPVSVPRILKFDNVVC